MQADQNLSNLYIKTVPELNEFFNPKNKETAAVINEINTISEDIRNFTHAISPLDLEKETLEEFVKRYEYELLHNTAYKDCKIELKKEITSNGKKGIRYFCKATAAHIPVEIISIAMEYDGKIILVTATAYWFKPSGKTDFVQLLSKTEEILNSIKVE